jgi:hypothetical protein
MGRNYCLTWFHQLLTKIISLLIRSNDLHRLVWEPANLPRNPRLPSSRTTRTKRSFSSMLEIVMQNSHHGNHEPALAARIEKT